MEKYVQQLIGDIKNAHRQEVSMEHIIDASEGEDFQRYIEEVERFFHGVEEEGTYTFSYYCGLNSIQFPPADRLSNQQMAQISQAFEKLLRSFNLECSLPQPLPEVLKYQTLISVLNEKVTIVEYGIIDLEFCDYEPDHCIFGAYCDCQKYAIEDEDFESFEDYDDDYYRDDMDNNDLPF